jgi:hypothetical protein
MATRPALAYNDAEKGTLDVRSPQIADLARDEKKASDIEVFAVQSLKKDAPVTPSNVAKPPPAPTKPAKKSTPLWVLWVIWYNSYRYGYYLHHMWSNTHHSYLFRRFFTVIFIVNFVGLGFAIAGKWPYAAKYPGALVVGNLNVAVLVRNEIFGRCLYWFVNTFFAKVRTKHF